MRRHKLIDNDVMKTSVRERPTEVGGSAFVVPDEVMPLVLDRTTDGVLLTDADGTIVYVNKPLLDLFGYEAIDLIGQPVEILLPDELRDSHRDSVQGFVHEPTPRPMGREDLDIEGRHADGSHIPHRRSTRRGARHIVRGRDRA